MQLKNDQPAALRRQLATAVFALLGTSLACGEAGAADAQTAPDKLRVDPGLLGPAPATAPRQVAAEEARVQPVAPAQPLRPATNFAADTPWQADVGLLYYKENDDRVQTTEAVVNLKRSYADDSSVVAKLTVDALTGGSPNGALPSKNVQTFSTPSGTTLKPPTSSTTPVTLTGASATTHNTLYKVAPGRLPIDPTFHDYRAAFSLSKERPAGSADRLTYGASGSLELDFISVSGNAAVAHDFNEKNTTLSAGINLEGDAIRPIGGAPTPLSDYAQFSKEGNKSKRVEDLLFGLTQVMSRRWITQLNYSLDRSNGYQNDPYKILSLLNSDGSQSTNAQNFFQYIYENRPNLRTRKSLYWDNKFAFDQDVLQFSYRYMRDDWGIRSQTADVHYRWALGDGSYFEPHVRRYKQTAADFFHYFLFSSDPHTLNFASADPRLAKFDAATLGIKYGVPMNDGGEFNVRFERYVQKGSAPDTASLPALQGLNLYPGLTAWIVQGSLRYSF
jgi:hypothetical protein